MPQSFWDIPLLCRQRWYKPGYVLLVIMECLSFIFAAACTARYSSLPPDNGRAALRCRYIWPCNSQEVRLDMSPYRPVGSYPTFSPLPRTRWLEAVIFCHLIPDVAAGFPLENAMLCVARTFLFMTSIERQTSSLPFFYFYDANLTLLFRFHNFFISFIPSLFKLFLKFALYIL